jgi:hypothetical protein
MNGKPDTLKGSFYNNPTSDLTPGLKAGDEATPNIWPKEESLEGYESASLFAPLLLPPALPSLALLRSDRLLPPVEAFKALCSFMVNIGLLVGGACDQLVGNTASNKSVKQLLEESHSGKARLLHYFPRPDSVFSLPPSSEVIETKEEVDDSWCGLHKDHGLLTVLCPSMYLFHSTPSESTAALEPLVIPAPSPSTGLFIKTRGGEIVQAKIPFVFSVFPPVLGLLPPAPSFSFVITHHSLRPIEKTVSPSKPAKPFSFSPPTVSPLHHTSSTPPPRHWGRKRSKQSRRRRTRSRRLGGRWKAVL